MVPERNKSAEIEGEQRKLEVLENEIAKIPKPKSIYLPTDEVKLLKIRLDGIKSSDIYNDFMQTNQELTRLESSLRYCRYIKSLYVIKEKSINSLSKNNTDLAIQEYEKYLKLPALDIAPSLIQSIQLQLGTITWHKTHSIVLAFNEINEHFQSKMNEKLLNLGWPEVNGEIDHEFISLFLDYTRLHCPSEASLSETTNNDIKTLEGISSGLLTNTIASFDCLALYHRLAFKSHFRGKKKTNQLDKPELYLDYLLGVFKKVSRFLNNVIQSILDDSKNNLIAMHEFISSCLIVVQEKLLADVPKLLQKDRADLVANIITNLLKFDETLISTYKYYKSGFNGVAGILLHNSSYRQAWLHYESESNFRLNLAAMESYESIVGEVEYLDMVEVSDSSDLNVITTKSAHEIGKLFEQDLVTYLNLSTNYLSEYFEIVHRHIFQIYVEKLSGILDTFSNNYYPVSKKAYSQTPKYADLKLLIRALNSLVFIRNRLDNWSTSDWYRNVKLPPFDALILLYKEIEKKCVQAIIEEFLGELKLNFYPYKGKKDFSYDVINVSNEFLGCVSIAGEIKILLKLICNELRDSILRDVLTQFDEYIMSNCVGLKLLDDKAAHEQIRRDILAFWKMFNVSGDDMPKLNNRVMRNRL